MTHETPILADDALPYSNEASFVPILGGAHSHAYVFESTDGPRVLRTDPETDYGFRKDAYAATHFASSQLPIPAVREINQMNNGTFFAVSDKCDGYVLSPDDSGATELMPELINVINAIHSTKPSEQGYGWWEPNGKGKHATWRETMERLQDLYLDKPELAKVDFFEPELMRRMSVSAKDLLGFCPEERKLVHGDLTSNMLTDGTKVTGIIDWSHSMYGDSLFDIAKLDLQFPNVSYAREFKAYYESQKSLPANFDERILCYKFLIGVSDMCYFAQINRPDLYTQEKKILLAALSELDPKNAEPDLG